MYEDRKCHLTCLVQVDAPGRVLPFGARNTVDNWKELVQTRSKHQEIFPCVTCSRTSEIVQVESRGVATSSNTGGSDNWTHISCFFNILSCQHNNQHLRRSSTVITATVARLHHPLCTLCLFNPHLCPFFDTASTGRYYLLVIH